MFERRLRILMLLLAMPIVAIVLRLLQLQILNAEQYRAETDRLLLRPVQYFPCLRGEIVDHDGQNRLAYDAPAWNISVDFSLLNDDEKYRHELALRRYRNQDLATALASLDRDVDAAWSVIAQVSGKPLADVVETRDREVRKVIAIKQAVEKRRGVQTTVKQEAVPLPIVRGLDQTQQAIARERLKPYEWISVVADQRRVYGGGPAVGHLIGLSQIPQLGEVGIEDVAQKRYADVPLGELYEYVPGDLKGVSGVEMMGERWLRGRRGRQQKDYSGNIVADNYPPADAQNGKQLRLTIDLPLQQAVYEILAKGVKASQYSTGGAAVILDVPSREVLAIVSCPSYDPNIPREKWVELLEDDLHQPLSFRPLQMRYPPGSTVKPMLLAAGLTDGVISSGTTVNCQGHLDPGRPDRYRCTAPHGTVEPIFAVQHSCNIFFYKLGEHLGSEKLAWWMAQFGLGAESGIGFPQEAEGHLPKNTNAGWARLAGIGQAEVDVTPVQVANMMATLAAGVYRPVSLWADDPRPRPARPVLSPTGRPITNDAWRVAREGMYRAVNTFGGTAFTMPDRQRATLTDAGDYILIGKTGSATGARRVEQWFYTCHMPGGATVEEAASSKIELERKYPGANVVRTDRAASRIPPEGIDPTHAWFAGYLTTRQRYRESKNDGKLNVAIAVLIEYAGHGGEAAAPVALQMIRSVLERQGEIAPGAGDEGEAP